MKTILIFVSVLLFTVTSGAQVKKVACIGASITEGAGTGDKKINSYPAQLGRMLGEGYQVENYGIGGTTLLRHGNHPYWKTSAYTAALQSNPDIVFIDLGGNDAKGINRPYYGEMIQDARDMVKSFAGLPSHPRIFVMLPFASFEPDTNQIWDAVIVQKITPRLRQFAFEDKVEMLDMHPMFIGRRDLYADNIHPNKDGATIIAQRLYEQILVDTDTGFDIFKSLKIPYIVESFGGYECVNFSYNGRNCKIAKPKVAAKGHPWLWRTRFWGHEPQADLALLERGFHIVYCDAAELMGNKENLDLWNGFYKLLRKGGLSKKSAMEGMSRGGIYSFNWAIAHPDRITCVYVDNPLLDCKFFLRDRGLTQLTKDFMAAYDIKTPEEIEKFTQSSMDKIKQIVKGKYPILILCGDADKVVPPETQTFLFEKKVKAAGGDITVITKPGFDHHPHSLPNPAPIVDFVLKATK
jgi:lysophospholipase L1-like esterase/pimeloyl-ACP methyl ester carboxylesterase